MTEVSATRRDIGFVMVNRNARHAREIRPGQQTARDRHTDALSPGELRVLRFLPTNLTRPEIAGELCLSVHTVGTHIRHIYSKLGARDRSSAVQRARELGLLARGRSGESRSPDSGDDGSLTALRRWGTHSRSEDG